MKLIRIAAWGLMLVMTMTAFASCDSEKNPNDEKGMNFWENIDNAVNADGDNNESGVNYEQGDLAGGQDHDMNGSNGTANETFPADKNAEVYERYTNFTIDRFNNGIAAIQVSDNDRGAYRASPFGFIDINGNVVIEAKYYAHSERGTRGIPTFEYNYTYVSCNEGQYIIDKTGNIIFERGKNGISEMGDPSMGYFWVESYVEKLEGNVYTLTYYSAEDLSIRATLDNTRSVYLHSNVAANGEFLVQRYQDGYSAGQETLNMADYDSSFVSADIWTVDIDRMEAFSGAVRRHYQVSGDDVSGRVAVVALINRDQVWFYAIVNAQGELLLAPQQAIAFPREDAFNKEEGMENYVFCKGLCPAKDAKSGCWGYVDIHGEWKITPKYSSAGAFSPDGYAVVNGRIVIDLNENVVLAPTGWTNEVVTSLSGTYRHIASGGETWDLIFKEDGTMRCETSRTGIGGQNRTYQINGFMLKLDRSLTLSPIKEDDSEGAYSFRKEGDTLFIGGTAFKLVETKK